MIRDKNLQVISVLMLIIVSFFLALWHGEANTSLTTLRGTGTIHGVLVKGPISGGTVIAYAVVNGRIAGHLGSGQTDKKVNFIVTVRDYSGPVLLLLSGGTFIDETSGSTMPMFSGDVMTATIPQTEAGSTVNGISIDQSTLRPSSGRRAT
jgi:hypothetical protein